jgi:AcrR family transcriptional regulator
LRRQHVLDCACRAFADLGYAGASLGEIATRAELTKAAVLHHFGSKESLYGSVLAETVAALGGLVATAAADRGSFPERLDRLGATVVDYLGAHPAAAKLLLAELCGRGPFARGPGRAAVDAALRAVAGFLDAGMRSGAFRTQSAPHLTLSIVGVHLLYFAADDITGTLIGGDPFAADHLAARRTAILQTVRAMCLPSPA